MNYSIEWLKHQVEQHTPIEFFFFWGHTQKKAGVIDKSCFSQWYESLFTVNEVLYKTTEHWMMAKKAGLFNDSEAVSRMLLEEKPASVKNIGREVKNFVPAAWSAVAYSIVVEGNQHKFSQHAHLKTFLLQTGNKIIVEASPADTVWGIGLAQDSPEAFNPFRWRGTNLLGFALMKVRDMMKQGTVGHN